MTDFKVFDKAALVVGDQRWLVTVIGIDTNTSPETYIVTMDGLGTTVRTTELEEAGGSYNKIKEMQDNGQLYKDWSFSKEWDGNTEGLAMFQDQDELTAYKVAPAISEDLRYYEHRECSAYFEYMGEYITAGGQLYFDDSDNATFNMETDDGGSIQVAFNIVDVEAFNADRGANATEPGLYFTKVAIDTPEGLITAQTIILDLYCANYMDPDVLNLDYLAELLGIDGLRDLLGEGIS